MSISDRILLAANRVFPRPTLPGDVAPDEYADWEYATSDLVIEMWREAGGCEPRTALDLGCGLGGKTRRLLETAPGLRITALDIEAKHLLQAEAYHCGRGIRGIAKIRGDASRLPFAAGAFHRIVTADTLEHFRDAKQSLREMRRCVSDDGRVILIFNPWGSPRGSHLGDVLRLPWCQLLFSRDTLVRATRESARSAARTLSGAEAAAMLDFGEELVRHFLEDVHPTRIRDFRRWIHEDGLFAVEREWHRGPGPLRRARGLSHAWLEEWLSASYGAVLVPR